MKRILLFSFFLLSLASVKAQQWVHIPDPNFRALLQLQYSVEPQTDLTPFFSGDSLNVSAPEVQAIHNITLHYVDTIYDLTGIEFFEGLTYLDAVYMELPNFSTTVLPDNLLHLNIQLCGLDSFPSLPQSLTNLACDWNGLTSVPTLPPNLESFSCSENDLTELPVLPSTLTHLDFYENAISQIPAFPPNLISFTGSYNNLSSLPALPSTLETLACTGNSLTEIPALPAGLKNLYVGANQIGELPTLPTGLTHLSCGNNLFTELPVLPETLLYLSVAHHTALTLPELPDSIEYIFCPHSGLTEVPALPAALEYLYLNNNELTELPALPLGLTDLYVHENQLSSLPALPPVLENLDCSHNQLTSLPDLPFSLISFDCSYNLIQILPELPGNWMNLVAHNNLLQCLPIIPEELASIDFEYNFVNCVPNIAPGVVMYPDTLEICTANNPHNCDHLNLITGQVYFDENDNCNQDGTEIDLSGRVIESSWNGSYAISDTAGTYQLYVDTGEHTIVQHLQNNVWGFTCPGVPYTLTVDTLTDTIPNIDFPNHATDLCPWLTVDIGATNQRPCFNTNAYSVSYCNHGTTVASQAYVEVELQPEIIPLASSIPYTDLGNGTFRFDLGDLDIDECGSFQFTDSVICDTELMGYTACVRAEIFPTSPCLTGDPGWDGSSIEVEASCVANDSISFTITNVGSGNMQTTSTYSILQDYGFVVLDVPFQLNMGESMVVTIPADGYTYRIEAEQSEGHPGNSNPMAWIEGCGSPVVLGSVTCFDHDDQDDHVSITCNEYTSAYDPNDKRVIPEGFGPDHDIYVEDTLLQYTIRFQNTGTDTAFNIEVVDTLPVLYLDPATFRSGASSHPYTVDMHGDGIVTWRFENILLPDSFVNEPASNGFVKFKIRQRENNPVGTVIENSAAIYFDYNAAIITNTSFVTISDDVLIVSVGDDPEMQLDIFPNPSKGLVNIQFDRKVNGRLEVRDAIGKVVSNTVVSGSINTIDLSQLEPGIYQISLFEADRITATGKVSLLR